MADWRSRAIPVDAAPQGGGWRARAVPVSAPDDGGEYQMGAASEPEKTSALEAGLRGAAQGATLGFSDELVGGGEALLDKLRGEDAALSDLYAKHRDESRAANTLAQKEHGTAYGAGEVGGGLASQALLAGATGGGSLAAQAGLGALSGGVAGAGLSDAKDAEGVLTDAGKGAALGGALGLGGGLVAKGVGALAGRVNQFAGGKVAEGLADASARAADKVESGILSAKGAAGAEIQKGSRLVENLLRAESTGELTPHQAQLLGNLRGSGEWKQLVQGITDNNLEALPEQLGTIGAKKQALSDLVNNKAANIASEADRIAGPEEALRQVGERAKRYGPVWAGGIAGKVLGTAETPGALAGAGLRPSIKAVGRMLSHPSVKVPTFKALQAITAANPAALGRYGGVLSRALAEGEDSFNAKHFVLSQSDPSYRDMLAKVTGDTGSGDASP